MSIQQIGRYEVESELGRGGMAVVYKARDPRFDRMVAVKVLPREFMHDPQFIGRFIREAKTIAALDHPAIVPVFDYGEEDGQPFIVMRYMPGGSLAEKLDNGPLPLEQATVIIQRLSSALNRAHSQGIVHRDLKPNNVLFDQYDDAYLADFGIAHVSSAAGTTSSLTASGSMLGTPVYMSPEQIHGDSQLDGRSDIYALGIIYFQMLTGRVPYTGDTATKILMKHIMEPVPNLHEIRPDLPVECQDVISRAMAKKPEQRFTTADEMATAITVINDRVRFAEYNSGTGISGTTPFPAAAGTLARPATPLPVPGTPRPRTPSPLPALPQSPAAARETPPPVEVFVPSGGTSIWVWLGLGALLLFCLGGIAVATIWGFGSLASSGTNTPTLQPSAVVDVEGTAIAEATAAFIAEQGALSTAQAGTATALFRPTITPGPTLTPPPSRTPTSTPDAVIAEGTPAAAATLAPTRPASTAITLPPIFGPVSGELVHDDDDFIESYPVDTNSRDFILQADFGVPFTALVGTWDIGFIFRQAEGDNAMRLVLRSTGYWSLNNRVGRTDNFIVEGNVSQFVNLRTNQTNKITLIAHGDRGYFLLNDNFVAVLDLSDNLSVGDVALGTGFYGAGEKEGYATTFADFYIWSQLPDFGPFSGELEHVDDGFIESYSSDVLLANFVVDAIFTNPYGPARGSWDVGFSFRREDNRNQYWVVADSTDYWGHINRIDGDDFFLSEGEVGILNLGATDQNRLTLIAWNDLGYFLVNDELIATLDLSDRLVEGDITVITAFFLDNEVPGEITRFTDFTIWALP
ncbi:MAG: protein kinase [Anaerolineae bacterium]|nr:protein kinase [Anaerolineae bacterium]